MVDDSTVSIVHWHEGANDNDSLPKNVVLMIVDPRSWLNGISQEMDAMPFVSVLSEPS
ncbi:MAG: hypothetical protein ACXACG_07365 [Candidatus Thorarchaeota archaeon]